MAQWVLVMTLVSALVILLGIGEHNQYTAASLMFISLQLICITAALFVAFADLRQEKEYIKSRVRDKVQNIKKRLSFSSSESLQDDVKGPASGRMDFSTALASLPTSADDVRGPVVATAPSQLGKSGVRTGPRGDGGPHRPPQTGPHEPRPLSRKFSRWQGYPESKAGANIPGSPV